MASTRVIACFGDSLTEGFGLHSAQALPAVLENELLQQGHQVRCVNMGVSGDTSGDGRRRLKKVLKAKPCVCVVAFGTNDFFVGAAPGELEENLSAILDGLAACRIQPVLAGAGCLAEFGEEYKREFDAVFPLVAARYQAPLLPDLLGTYLRDPAKTLIDQLHPNEHGVRSMVRALAPVVAEALRKLD